MQDTLIKSLKPNEVFVFGSNTSGRHGKGAAKQAMSWGAVYGQSDGLQGRTYGIPTLDGRFKKLDLRRIQYFVDNFIVFASEHTELTFLVTDIGCGLAGFKHKEIAPMFRDALIVPNIVLPKSFKTLLN